MGPGQGQEMAIISLVVTSVLAVIFALIKALDSQREKSNDKRLNDLEATERAHSERLRLNELETKELKGKNELLESKLATAIRDVEEIERQGITRAEWERAMREVDRRLDEILKRLDNQSQRPGSYSMARSPSESRMEQVRPK